MFSDKVVIDDKSALAGRGAFAAVALNTRELVWEPSPDKPLLNYEEFINIRRESYASQIDIDAYVESFDPKEWCMNHSCAANCVMRDRKLVAARPIEKGEELTYDYGLTEINYGWAFWCACGAESCRLHVSNKDYVDKSLRRRLRSVCPDYAEKAAQSVSRGTIFKYLMRRRFYQLKRQLLGTDHSANRNFG